MIQDQWEADLHTSIRAIARQETNRVLMKISADLNQAYIGGRFDGYPGADAVVEFVADTIKSAVERT